jgi:NADPH2:quinone reductase
MTAQQMRYVALEKPGAADAMQIARGPAPQPAAGQVLIRVIAAGINRPDIAQRQGAYPPPADASPILGLEVAGEVVALGEQVDTLRTGDRVCALTHGGGYAEYCVADARHCLPWPKDYDALQAAVLPENHFTVWSNVFQLGELKRGEALLVHGGSSGIGTTAIQLGREFGAAVYTTAGSPEKCAVCERLGAMLAVDYRQQDFETAIKQARGGRGVDVILDMVGGSYTPRNLRLLAQDGRLVQIATLESPKVESLDLREVMKRRARLTGSTLRPRTPGQKAAIASALREQVWPVLDAGRCAPLIHQVYDFTDVVEAHRMMESSAHIGKLVLRVAAE